MSKNSKSKNNADAKASEDFADVAASIDDVPEAELEGEAEGLTAADLEEGAPEAGAESLETSPATADDRESFTLTIPREVFTRSGTAQYFAIVAMVRDLRTRLVRVNRHKLERDIVVTVTL